VTTSAGAPLLTAGSGGGAGGPGHGLITEPGTVGADSGAGLGAGLAGNAGSFPNAAGSVATNSYDPAGRGGAGGAGYGSGGQGGGGGVVYDGSSLAGGSGGSGGGGSDLISGTVPGTSTTLTDGSNAGNGSVVFTFTAAAPTVTSISPSNGPKTGGNTVTITGTSLYGATVIDFSGGGGDATTFSCTSETTCTAVVPSWGAGCIHVLVTTPSGTSAATAGSDYTYNS
jgi:hypothetical protein